MALKLFLAGAVMAAAVIGLIAVFTGTQLPRRPPGAAKPPAGRVLMAAACGIGALIFTGIPVTLVLGVALGWWTPGMVAATRARHHRLERKEAISVWARQVSDVMANSRPVTAIRASVATAPPLIAPEVAAFGDDLERMGFADAAHLLAERLGDTDGEIVAAALIVANASGGAAARVLVELAQSAADNAEMCRRVDAARAGLDVRARLITGFFISGFVLARLISPGLIAPFHTAAGQIVLAAVAAMFTLSYVWLGRMRTTALPDTILARQAVPA